VKSFMFWSIISCSPLKTYRRFGGTCRLHLQGLEVSQGRNQHEAGSNKSLLRAIFLLGKLLNPEDGGT
jgi:hypothetical protein